MTVRRKRLNDRVPVATAAVLIICLAVHLCTLFFTISNETETAIFFGAYYKALIAGGEWWRLLTCGLVHVSVIHLFMNSLSLINIGTLFEKRFGIIRYLIILFGSVAGGSLFMYAAEGNKVAVGLSGGLYGLMGGYVMICITTGLWKNSEVLSSLVRIILINLMINFMPGIAVTAHAGGFITGMILTAIFIDEAPVFRRNMLIAGLIFAVALGWFCYKGTMIRQDQKYLLTDYHILAAEKKAGFEKHAYRIAANLDTIYGEKDVLTVMLEEGYNDD